jgi:hypothetical protein
MGGPRPPDFEEVQRFHHPGVWVLVAVPVGFAWVAAIWQVFLGNRFGDKPAPDWVLILVWALAARPGCCPPPGDQADARGECALPPPLSGRRFLEDNERQQALPDPRFMAGHPLGKGRRWWRLARSYRLQGVTAARYESAISLV